MKSGCKTGVEGSFRVGGTQTSAFYLLGVGSHSSHHHCFWLCAVLMDWRISEFGCVDPTRQLNDLSLWFIRLKIKDLYLEKSPLWLTTEPLCIPMVNSWIAFDLLLCGWSERRENESKDVFCDWAMLQLGFCGQFFRSFSALIPLCMNMCVLPAALKNFSILCIHLLHPQTKCVFMAGRRKHKEMTHPDNSNEISFYIISCIC